MHCFIEGFKEAITGFLYAAEVAKKREAMAMSHKAP